MIIRFASAAALACLGPALACTSQSFTEKQQLGGVGVSPAALNAGHRTYHAYCSSCHGETGKGDGPAAASLEIKPRDFSRAQFRYGSVPKGALPTDTDLLRVLAQGVPGTHMSAWQGLSEEDRHNVVHYIKTLSPRWRAEVAGKPVAVVGDPYSGNMVAALAHGAEVFHGNGGCNGCHPSYRQPVVARRVQASDFTSQIPRGGSQSSDLYRSIAVGIGDSPMPGYAQTLPARDLWAVVHYVKDLVRSRGTPRAAQLRAASAANAPEKTTR